MNNMEEMTLTDNAYSKVLLNIMHDLQKSNSMCDIKLIVNGQSINAHKLILNAVSPYFRWMESGNFSENQKNEITFQNMEFVTLKQIVNFIYTGEIMLNESNIFDVMEAADMFRISMLKPAIFEFILKSLSVVNCVQSLAYAKQFNYEELAEEILAFIWDNFLFIVTKEDIIQTTPLDILEIILCSNSLNPRNIYFGFEKWKKHKIENIPNLSFEDKLLAKQYISHLEELEMLSPEYSVFISRVRQYIADRFSETDYIINGDEHPDDDCVDRKTEIQVLVTFGGEAPQKRILSDAECNFDQNWSMHLPELYHPKHNLSSSVMPAMRTPRSNFAHTSRKYRVYVMGGKNEEETLDSCEMYDLDTNEWSEFPALPKKLHGCKAAMVDNVMYVTGGLDETSNATNEVWKYNERERAWKKFPSMQEPRAFHGACSVRGVLYVMGGQGANWSTMERYDENLGRWFYVTPMPEHKWDFGCVAYRQFIYIFGGVKGYDYKMQNTVHEYNTLWDSWEKCCDMLTFKGGMSCATKDNKIYLIGGYNHAHGPMGITEVYNPLTGRWNLTSGKLTKWRKNGGGAALYIPSVPKYKYHTGM